jgi:hypothetical protein
MLEAAPGLEAKTIVAPQERPTARSATASCGRYSGRSSAGGRARPHKEVMFPQQHRPGEYAQSTSPMNDLGSSSTASR